MTEEASIRARYLLLRSSLNERSRRLWAAAEVKVAGRGGFCAVLRATGLSPTTLAKACRELKSKERMPLARVRRPGGGRKCIEARTPEIVPLLERLVDSGTRGDPEAPLRWTSKSIRNLAGQMRAQGQDVSYVTVARLLSSAGYSLQANCKTKEGTHHPDRNAQFEYINSETLRQMQSGNPTISVDTKKKELVGAYRNGGREWHFKASPEKVQVHDFIDPKKGKAIPYGVYDLRRNAGWVSIGITHDTAAFAVETIRKWWRHMGKKSYPHARSLMITADSGGSNGARVRLWKCELQRFANKSGLAVQVCHFPPGTSKWNKIEHRLFSFITQNWRGKPLRTLATIVNLIASTRTRAGLKVRCELDTRHYPKAIKVPDAELRQVRLTPHEFHGEWNYTISPSR